MTKNEWLTFMIEMSKSDEKTENEISSVLLEAKSIKNKAKKLNQKLAEKFEKEYEEVRKSIKNALDDDRKFSKIERMEIMLELSDMMKIANDNNIDNSLSWYNRIREDILWANTDDIKEKTIKITEKNIEDYSKEEAIWALEYLNNNYLKYSESNIWWRAEELLENISGTESIKDIDTRDEVRIFQEKLIEKILGSDKWFNDEYIQWFSSDSQWHFLIKIEHMSTYIKNTEIKEINSKALANYFKYLTNWWTRLDKESLIAIFWIDRLLELWNIWSDPEKPQYAKKELESLWLKQIIDIIELFSSPQNFLNKIWSLNENWQKEALKFFEENLNNIKDKFKTELLDLYLKNNPLDKKEAEKNIDLFLINLNNIKEWFKDWTKSIKDLLITFDSFSKEHKLWLSVKDIEKYTKKSVEISENETELKIIYNEIKQKQAEKKWDKEKLIELENEKNILERDIKTLKYEWAILDKIIENDDETVKKIISWEIDYDKYIENLIENDDELKKQSEEIKKIQEENRKKEKNREEELIKSNETTKQNSENITEIPYSLNQETWTIEFTSDNWKQETIKLNPIEKNIIESHPEALEKIVNFYKVLDKIWLSRLWEIKDQIFTGISNVTWTWFSIDWNYLNENETKIFLNSILKSVWIDEIPAVFTLDNFISSFEQKNNTQIGWEEAENNKYWQENVTKIEWLFLNKFSEKWSIIWFKSSEFMNSIE